MCGIAGIFSFTEPLEEPKLSADIQSMMALMQRRGPDDQGTWISSDQRLGLGFKRLAVLDPSPAGHQPMVSPGGRSVLVMNGEIYNYLEIKRELESRGHLFCSRADSEVLLHALDEWDIEVINRLNGMFAFAWYNTVSRVLTLARDHAGIKPLYYAIAPGNKELIFASQYNQLLLSPWGKTGKVREDVLHLYLRLHHIPPPYGILENTFQLEPGHWLRVSPDGRLEDRVWWQLPRTPAPELAGDDALEAAGMAIQNAVTRQMVSDVPLGVFLSGGVDSPLVTAFAQQQHVNRLKAFTIGNPGWRQDESADAKRYAEALNVDFRLHNIADKDMIELVQNAWQAQYEPFADYSILPTMLVSRFARGEITVALSGDGGDELFFGYERPLSLLRNGADFRFTWLTRYALYAAGRLGLIPRRSEVIAARSPAAYYFGVNSRMSEQIVNRLAPGIAPLPADFTLYNFGNYKDLEDLAHYSRYVEFYGQLQRGLKKMDMASMHHSLEVRVPLLDREVIDTSLRIDPFTNMENDKRKQVLVKLLGRFVTQDIIPETKRGFAVPLGEWLRAPLRPVIEDMLLSTDLYPSGLFNKKAVHAYWQEHLSGEKDYKWGLWSLMSLQGWASMNL